MDEDTIPRKDHFPDQNTTPPGPPADGQAGSDKEERVGTSGQVSKLLDHASTSDTKPNLTSSNKYVAQATTTTEFAVSTYPLLAEAEFQAFLKDVIVASPTDSGESTSSGDSAISRELDEETEDEEEERVESFGDAQCIHSKVGGEPAFVNIINDDIKPLYDSQDDTSESNYVVQLLVFEDVVII